MASQPSPIVGRLKLPESMPSLVALEELTATKVLVTFLTIVIIIPRVFTVLKNAFSPISSIPGRLLNKLSPWPLTIATIKGTSHHFARSLHDKYGPIVVLAPGMIAVADTKEIRRIIQKEDWVKSEAIYGNFRQDPQRPMLLAYTDKKAYAKRKRMLSSMFGIKYIRSMEPIMMTCVEAAVKQLNKFCDEGTQGAAVVDMQHLIHSLAIDVIGITTFGGSLNVVDNGSHPLPSRLKAGLRIAGLMQLIPWIRFIPFLPTRDPYVDKFVYDIVDGRRQELESKQHSDLLQKLVEASDDSPGSDFRTSDVQDESVVMLTAGSETTANAELFTLMMLLKNPQVMKKHVDEVDQWYPPSEPNRQTDCGYSQAGMTYLQACIDETMRLVPGQATGSPRETSKDDVILGYRIPAGTTVFPNTQESHMQDAHWEEPQKFVPERWLESQTTNMPYWPFSAGSRVCIGRQLPISLGGRTKSFERGLIPCKYLNNKCA